MLDIKLLRSNPEKIKEALKQRKADAASFGKFAEIDSEWRKLTLEIDELRARRNKASESQAKDGKELREKIKELEEKKRTAEEQLNLILLQIPNIPDSSVPAGKSAEDNVEIRRSGKPPCFTFTPKPHFEIGEKLGILDFERATKVSGSRFVILKGLAAKLERALINLLLDTHTKENGYTEVFPPILVNTKSMQGTGQLPKFEEDLYHCSDDLWLLPTAEVSVTNIHREEILSINDLPLKYCAYTPCFRREAGSYGKNVRGLNRLHQFDKVELVKFVHPSASYDELDALRTDAEHLLQLLGLPYRTLLMCTGDMGFTQTKKFDLEVWAPGQNKWLEVSSCSNFEAFQARRMNLRFRPVNGSKPEFVHTLNGSGLALPRVVAALIEHYQTPEGKVVIPKVLHPYTHFEVLG